MAGALGGAPWSGRWPHSLAGTSDVCATWSHEQSRTRPCSGAAASTVSRGPRPPLRSWSLGQSSSWEPSYPCAAGPKRPVPPLSCHPHLLPSGQWWSPRSPPHCVHLHSHDQTDQRTRTSLDLEGSPLGEHGPGRWSGLVPVPCRRGLIRQQGTVVVSPGDPQPWCQALPEDYTPRPGTRGHFAASGIALRPVKWRSLPPALPGSSPSLQPPGSAHAFTSYKADVP